ncbi:MAG: hypothetical protein DI629_12055 [Mesorhizobium amorphae]|nr:MAG: hypothetical protein DI629_12055 [Mesorhizobium amorphae]
MPQLVAAAVLPILVNASVGAVIVPGTLSALATGIGYAATAGIAVLGQSMLATKPEQPKPEDVQTNFRQPIPVRTAFYGQVKAGGAYLFRETHDGRLHQVIALASCQVGSIEEFWIDDEVVERATDGRIMADPYEGDVRILFRLGLPVETAYGELAAVFPGKWTSAHRADGVATLFTTMNSPSQENMSEQFPNLQGTLFRAVMRRAGIFDPTSSAQSIFTPATWTYSDNLARVVMDYLWNKDGMRLPVSMLITPQALEGWRQAVNDCNDPIPLKGGGTEPRYRIWNTFSFNERPGDVLRRFMAAGNARLVPTADGGIHLEVGKWRPPTVTIDETMITGFAGLTRGKSIMETANTIRAQFLSPVHDYQSADADPWIDQADVAERGEISRSVEFTASPSHGQTRRLMKIEAHRANPAMTATLFCNLAGLAAYGERFIRVAMPSFGIDHDCEVLDFQFIFGEHSTLIGASIQVQALGEGAFAWNAAAEEGTAPQVDATFDEQTIPAVANFSAAIVRISNGAALLPVARLVWTAPERGTLITELRYKRTTESAWQTIPVLPNATTADSPILDDGSDYEFQARYRTTTGRPGAWGISIVLTVVADPSPPGVVTDVSVLPGAGSAFIQWNAPGSPNYQATTIRRSTTNNPNTAALVRTEYGAPASSDSWTDSGRSPGTYYYWLRSRNASGAESAAVATGPVSIT